jgi:hypothetical protein
MATACTMADAGRGVVGEINGVAMGEGWIHQGGPMAELVCMKIHGVTVAEYKQRQAEQAAAAAADKAAQQQAAEQQQPQAATAGGFANSVYNPANQNDFSNGFGSSNPPPMPSSFSSSASNQDDYHELDFSSGFGSCGPLPMPSSFSSSASNQDDYHENVVKVDFSRPSNSNESNQQVQSEVIESKIAVGAEGQRVWTQPTSPSTGFTASAGNGSGGGSNAPQSVQQQAPSYSGNATASGNTSSYGGGGSSASVTPAQPAPDPEKLPPPLYQSPGDVGTKPGGAIGTLEESPGYTREQVVNFAHRQNERNPDLRLSTAFSHENLHLMDDGSFIGYKEKLHAEKHGPHLISDIHMSVSLQTGGDPNKRALHSCVTTADAFNAMRSTAIKVSEVTRSSKVQAMNAEMQSKGRELTPQELKKYEIAQQFSIGDFSDVDTAIMQRDGGGTVFASPKGQADISVYENVQGFVACYKPVFDAERNAYIFVEETVYPDHKTHDRFFPKNNCVESRRVGILPSPI